MYFVCDFEPSWRNFERIFRAIILGESRGGLVFQLSDCGLMPPLRVGDLRKTKGARTSTLGPQTLSDDVSQSRHAISNSTSAEAAKEQAGLRATIDPSIYRPSDCSSIYRVVHTNVATNTLGLQRRVSNEQKSCSEEKKCASPNKGKA
jgi:hypothetical protein